MGIENNQLPTQKYIKLLTVWTLDNFRQALYVKSGTQFYCLHHQMLK